MVLFLELLDAHVQTGWLAGERWPLMLLANGLQCSDTSHASCEFQPVLVYPPEFLTCKVLDA